MRRKIPWALIRTIIALPGTALVFIPVVILWVAKETRFAAEPATWCQPVFWAALAVGCIGYGLSAWTVMIFTTFGQGTPAPWDPPKKLFVCGPYRHVRNPMIIGALLMLAAEAMLLQSWPIAVWMLLFFVGNGIYFPLFEEKGLEYRFGDDYREYKIHVPRWIPRIRAWEQKNACRHSRASGKKLPESTSSKH